MSNFVFCQYTFWGQEDSVVVPPQINPDMVERQNSTGDTVMVKFQHKKVRGVQTDICMMHLLVKKKSNKT